MVDNNAVNDTFVPMQRLALAVVGLLTAALFVYLFTFGDRTPWLIEGGKGSKPLAAHFQLRPDPLAK